MNAPTPSPQSQICNFQGDLNGYSVTITSDSTTLSLSFFKESEIPRKRFEVRYDYETLLKKSKWFRLFDSIGNIANEISFLLKEEKFKLQESNEKLSLYLLIQSRQVEDILLEIPQTEVQNNNLIEDICSLVNSMKKTLDKHTKTFEALGKCPQFRAMIKKAEMIEKHVGLLDEDIKDLVINKISSTHDVEFCLLYIASVDGDSGQAFHSLCDNKGPTLTIVKTKKDLVFGGYASLPWDQCNNYKNDAKAFLFSMANNKTYPVSIPSNALYCNSTYGPTFGSGHDLHVANNCLSSSGSYVNFNGYSGGSLNELNGNERQFTANEVEVYQVILSKKQEKGKGK